MARKPLQISPKTLTKIAEALFLAYTEEQAAYLAKISERTLARIKHTELWQQVMHQRHEFEKPYRKKILNGGPGWQGAAWMLERQYASQLSKPEIQLSLNSGNTTNNTLVITAEAAAGLQRRASAIADDVESIVLNASNRTKRLSDTEPVISTTESTQNIKQTDKFVKCSKGQLTTLSADVVKTSADSVIEEGPRGPSAPRTPRARDDGREPKLPQNSQLLEFSRNSKTNVVPKEKSKQTFGKGGIEGFDVVPKRSLSARRARELAEARNPKISRKSVKKVVKRVKK